MAYLNFTDALTEAKRRASLQGREVSQQEAAGISEGIATSAGMRGIESEKLKTQKEQFAESLANQKDEFGRTMKQREKEWMSNVEQANNQYLLAKDQLAEQIRQFNESSEAQRAQFGEQMAYQIDKSNKEMKLAQQNYNLQLSTVATQMIQAGQPLPATLAPEGWNAQGYLAKNPDIAADPGWAAQPLRHYFIHGAGENRSW